MIKRLKVEIRKIEESEKNLLWELSTITDLNLVEFKQGKTNYDVHANMTYEHTDCYFAEFRTNLRKSKAIQQISSMFMKKDFKAFQVVSIR